jgi:hypothetical protein
MPFSAFFEPVRMAARQRLHRHHERDRQPALPAGRLDGECGESDDLQHQPGDEGAVQAASRAHPPAEQVGEDAHELVGEEQEGDGDG